jgi:hypothetical protein
MFLGKWKEQLNPNPNKADEMNLCERNPCKSAKLWLTPGTRPTWEQVSVAELAGSLTSVRIGT